jgi:hypothetical protein
LCFEPGEEENKDNNQQDQEPFPPPLSCLGFDIFFHGRIFHPNLKNRKTDFRANEIEIATRMVFP